MNVALRPPMSLDAFLAWEAAQALGYEFDGFRPVAMHGGTNAHSLIQANLTVALTTQLRGQPFRFHGSAVKIEVAGSVRDPDGVVVCTRQAADSRVVRDSVVIFEILSEPITRTDLGVIPNVLDIDLWKHASGGRGSAPGPRWRLGLQTSIYINKWVLRACP